MSIKQAPCSSEGPVTLLSCEGRGWRNLEASFHHVANGISVHACTWHRLYMHFGGTASTTVSFDNDRHRGVQAHGDFDLMPAGADGVWDGTNRKFMRLVVDPDLVNTVAHDLGHDPGKRFLLPKFRTRDARIEAVVWAIKAELESDVHSDRLYAESLAVALASRIVSSFDWHGRAVLGEGQMLSTPQRRRLVEYVETHLDQPLTLADLAAVAGMSVSHLKTLFRRTFGMPVHQYVMRARVEHAKRLLIAGDMPMSEAALAAGFSHQSHMARCMRQILGVTPGAIVKLRT